LSKIDGFSDVNINALGIDPISGILVIGYDNGNIDLLDENEIINIDLIKESSLTTGKKYHHINFSEGLAYLSADFGMVILDLSARAIRETVLNIGEGGSPLRINSTVILNDSLYLASEEGVMAAHLNSNLLDFNSYVRFGPATGIPAVSVQVIARLDGNVLAGVNGNALFSYDGNLWNTTAFLTDQEFVSASENPEGILICLKDSILIMNTDFSFEFFENTAVKSPTQAVLVGDEIWSTDLDGLIRYSDNSVESFSLSGPANPIPEKVRFTGNGIIALPEAFDEMGTPYSRISGFDLFKDGQWSNFNGMMTPGAISIPDFRDITDVIYQESTSEYVFSSYGYGLLFWDGDDQFEIVNENSPGSPLVNSNPPGRNTLITGLALSSSGVWVLNAGVLNSIHFLDDQDIWTTYSPNLSQSRNAHQALSVFDQVWLRVDPQTGGVVAFEPEEQTEVLISESFSQGDLPSEKVNDISLDQDGQVWIATDLGIVFFPNPFAVFDGDLSNSFPIFENRELLRDERITAIEFDGGNRIWIGTDDGVWLFSEATTRLIHNFTEENSPLISNRILDIEIDDRTGEVFFATEAGLVSFRGSATQGGERHTDVKIFPNPVRRNFEGEVGISGLAENVIVKITDVTGKLIRETRSNGGTAVWDVSDFSGSRAKTGIYLVFSSSIDGEETYIGKIAVLE
jgi:hypothetical protein